MPNSIIFILFWIFWWLFCIWVSELFNDLIFLIIKYGNNFMNKLLNKIL